MADLFDELKAKGGRGVMPAPQRMFGDVARKGTGEIKYDKLGNPLPNPNYNPVTEGFDFTKGGRYLEFGPEGKQDITGQTRQAAVIKIKPDGNAAMMVSPETAEAPMKKQVKGTSVVKTNLVKKKTHQGTKQWEWKKKPDFEVGDTDTSSIVSVEGRKDGKSKHYYALEAEYPNTLTMERYPDKESEPKLRPTKNQGVIELGEKVGEITMGSGKNLRVHPIYKKIRVLGNAGLTIAGGALAALGLADQAQAGDLELPSPGDLIDAIAPLGFEIGQAGAEGLDMAVPTDEQGEPVYPFLDEIDMRNNMLMRNPLLD